MKIQKGFTIIELLVVMAVVSIISTITLVNYRAGEKRKRVDIAADTLISALRLAQTYTLSGKNTSNPNTACRVPQYYYVTLTYTNTVGVFARNNCNTVDTIQIFTLPERTQVKASGLSIDGVFASSTMSVAFYPPFGITRALVDSGTYITYTSVDIDIQSTDGSINKSVRVDGVSGRIGE